VRSSTTLQDARIAFEQTEVRAPSDGVILSRTVEAGTVIAAASRDVGGGTTLLTMASLDTVQVRALVDETDIGRIHTGMPVTLTVAAFPNQQFSGDVLRIGAQAVAQQNVTMFPVLIRIRNVEGLLKPGMNAEVSVKVQDVHEALAVPNAALREPGDLASAAALLEIPLDSLESRSDAERPVAVPGRSAERGDRGDRSGRGQRGNRGARDRADANAAYGGRYDVLVKRDGAIRAVPVRTGVTDYDYSVVVSGLALGDTVVVLPTAGFLDDQAQRQQFIQRRVASPLGRG
jgi:HlyD family secretion protein